MRPIAVYAALAGNLAIALIKFVAAAMTRSSAMFSEGVHSLVDTINELLLLYGRRRADRPPDLEHPLGHGRELYFWSFIVALLVFALGAGVSFYEGLTRLRAPHPTERPLVAYLVLAASFVCEAVSWAIALREFRAAKGDQGYVEAFRASKDPTTFTVLFEDSAALIGLLIAATGLAGAQLLDLPQLDGVASIGIAVLLAVAAILLARETKQLLIGEPAHPHLRASILRLAGADPDIRSANGVITMQMGPSEVFAALSAEFEDRLDTTRLEHCVNRIEAAIKTAHPEVTVLFVKPQTEKTWRRRISRLGRHDDDSG
jgi:cation diffusion facilitator family transporter